MESGEQPDSRQPSDDAKPKQKNRNRRKLEKRDLALIDTGIGAWVVLLGFPTTFLYERHRIASLILLAAIATALLLGVALEYRHRWRGRRNIAWSIVLPVGALHGLSLLLALSAYLLLGRVSPNERTVTAAERTFTVVNFNALGNLGSQKRPWFVIRAETNETGVFFDPVDLLEFVEITNDLNEPRYIRAFSLEVRKNNVWHKLCPLDDMVLNEGNGRLFDVMFPKAGKFVKLPLLEEQLKASIPAHAPFSGWTLWACPVEDCATLPKRITFTDTSGRTEIVPLVVSADMKSGQLDAPISYEEEAGVVRYDGSKIPKSGVPLCRRMLGDNPASNRPNQNRPL